MRGGRGKAGSVMAPEGWKPRNCSRSGTADVGFRALRWVLATALYPAPR